MQLVNSVSMWYSEGKCMMQVTAELMVHQGQTQTPCLCLFIITFTNYGPISGYLRNTRASCSNF
jgi:hypothetical protein